MHSDLGSSISPADPYLAVLYLVFVPSMPGYHVDVGIMADYRDEGGIAVGGYIYVVSTPAQNLALYDVYWQPGPIKLPVLHAERVANLQDYLAWKHYTVPGVIWQRNSLYELFRLLRFPFEQIFYMSSWHGGVDAYCHRSGMAPGTFYLLRAHDIEDPGDWYSARDYRPIGPVRQLDWHPRQARL